MTLLLNCLHDLPHRPLEQMNVVFLTPGRCSRGDGSAAGHDEELASDFDPLSRGREAECHPLLLLLLLSPCIANNACQIILIHAGGDLIQWLGQKVPPAMSGDRKDDQRNSPAERQ